MSNENDRENLYGSAGVTGLVAEHLVNMDRNDDSRRLSLQGFNSQPSQSQKNIKYIDYKESPEK